MRSARHRFNGTHIDLVEMDVPIGIRERNVGIRIRPLFIHIVHKIYIMLGIYDWRVNKKYASSNWKISFEKFAIVHCSGYVIATDQTSYRLLAQ